MTHEEYTAKLKRIEELMEADPELGSDEGRELDALADEVVAYEREHYPLTPFPEAPPA